MPLLSKNQSLVLVIAVFFSFFYCYIKQSFISQLDLIDSAKFKTLLSTGANKKPHGVMGLLSKTGLAVL